MRHKTRPMHIASGDKWKAGYSLCGVSLQRVDFVVKSEVHFSNCSKCQQSNAKGIL